MKEPLEMLLLTILAILAGTVIIQWINTPTGWIPVLLVFIILYFKLKDKS